MYTELNSLLEQNVTDDAWYDDGFLVAQDMDLSLEEMRPVQSYR